MVCRGMTCEAPAEEPKAQEQEFVAPSYRERLIGRALQGIGAEPKNPALAIATGALIIGSILHKSGEIGAENARTNAIINAMRERDRQTAEIQKMAE